MNYSDIELGNNLIKDKYCEITYSGYLFQNNSDSVTIVYGFDDDWKYTDAKKMIKTDEGFVVSLKMQNCSSFNFCFRNDRYDWDNNNGKNFTLPISDISTDSEDLSLADISLVNDSIIDNVLSHAYEEKINEVHSIDLGVKEFAESVSNVENTIEEFEAFPELNEPTSLDETLVNSVENFDLSKYLSEDLNSDKQNLLNNILSSSSEFNMDSLVDEILSPVSSTSEFSEESEKEFFNEYTGDIVSEDSSLDDKIDSLLTNIYENIDSIKNETTSNFVESENTTVETPEPVLFADTVEDLENDEQTDNQIDTLIKKIYRKVDVVDSEPTVAVNEPSLLEEISENHESTSLIVSPRALSKAYLFKKKIKLAFMKILKLLPKGSTSSDYDR